MPPENLPSDSGGGLGSRLARGDEARKVRRALGFVPLVMAAAAAVTFGRHLPDWQFMGLIAMSLYAACKLHTWWAQFVAGRAGWGRSVAYLLAWTGMDAAAFLDPQRVAPRPAPGEWVRSFSVMAIGAALIWAICPLLPMRHPLLVGWVGMLGLILMLHFGAFALISVAWRRMGIDAQPLMNRPLSATSLADFWGRRWNTAFHALAQRLVFRPTLRIAGVRGAVLATFIASGLIHDLVISVPARGGYGLPTVYFIVQGLGVLVERSAGRGRGLTILLALGPVFLLFHPPFVLRVIVPFLAAIHAIHLGGVP